MIDRIRDLDSGSAGVQAEQLKQRALEMSSEARERFANLADRVRDYTQNQPAQALGLALGMGVLLGWLIKRR